MAVNDAIARLQYLVDYATKNVEMLDAREYDYGYYDAIQQALHIINAEA